MEAHYLFPMVIVPYFVAKPIRVAFCHWYLKTFGFIELNLKRNCCQVSYKTGSDLIQTFADFISVRQIVLSYVNEQHKNRLPNDCVHAISSSVCFQTEQIPIAIYSSLLTFFFLFASHRGNVTFEIFIRKVNRAEAISIRRLMTRQCNLGKR